MQGPCAEGPLVSTREELLYEAFKADMNSMLTAAEQQTDQVKDMLGHMLQSAQVVTDSMAPVQSNPLLARHFNVRQLIRPLISVSNLLEICVDTRLPALVTPLREALNQLASDEVVLAGTEVTTDVAALTRPLYRSDHLVVSQKVEIHTGPADSAAPLSLVVHQAFFLKIGKGQKPQIAALATPVLVAESPEAELFAMALEFKLVGMVFADKFKSEVPLELPDEFTQMGLTTYAVRLADGLARVYYSSRRSVPPAADAPSPSSPSVINIKLTHQLLDDIFRPKVKSQLEASSLGMAEFKLRLLEDRQLVRAEIVGSKEVSKYVGNVKFWGKGFARVLQHIQLSRSADGRLQVRGEGDPQILGNPWVGEAGASVDTLLGSIGVSLPDEAVEFLWEAAKALRIGLPVSLPSSTVDEVIDLAPQRLIDIRIRSTDAVLSTR